LQRQRGLKRLVVVISERIRSSRKTTAKARNPGISRRDCRMPISAPVKAACSIAKLLSNACQVAKLKGTAPAMM
jgi:hypothetical protein